MDNDVTVMGAIETRDDYQVLHAQALEKVQEEALSAYQGDETDGRKEWSQGEWEIRLRTSKTPLVQNLVDLIEHLAEISAVKAVIKRLKLSKKDTVDLHETLQYGLRGLEIEEKTTCSVKRKIDA